MQPLITYMQQLDSGQILNLAGILTIWGFGLWAGAELIKAGVQIYADLAGQRAKEGKE
jgi:hypothetical protein